MIASHTGCLVGDHHALVAGGILGGDPHRAVIGVAAAGLDAAQGKHHAPGRVAQAGPQGQGADHVKGRGDLAGCNDVNLTAQADAPQGAVDQ